MERQSADITQHICFITYYVTSVFLRQDFLRQAEEFCRNSNQQQLPSQEKNNNLKFFSGITRDKLNKCFPGVFPFEQLRKKKPS